MVEIYDALLSKKKNIEVAWERNDKTGAYPYSIPSPSGWIKKPQVGGRFDLVIKPTSLGDYAQAMAAVTYGTPDDIETYVKARNGAFKETRRLIAEEFPNYAKDAGVQLAVDRVAAGTVILLLRQFPKVYRFTKGVLQKKIKGGWRNVEARELDALTSQFAAKRIAPNRVGLSKQLEFKHQLKADKVTDVAELNRQIDRQVARMNEIIEKEGMQGLKQRIRNYNKALEQQGRAHVKTLGDPGDGLTWLHEPDMRTGGGPKDVFGTGDKRINSVLGGQANRLAEDILNMPDSTTRIEPKITVIPSK
jgi:hypothetical protein